MPETQDFRIDDLCETLAKWTSLNSLTLAINNYGNKSRPWGYKLDEALARSTSLNSLTLEINNYYDTSWFSGCELGVGLAKITSLNSLTLAIGKICLVDSLQG